MAAVRTAVALEPVRRPAVAVLRERLDELMRLVMTVPTEVYRARTHERIGCDRRARPARARSCLGTHCMRPPLWCSPTTIERGVPASRAIRALPFAR